MWPHVITWLEGHLTLWVSFPIVSNHPAKFGGQKPCRRGDILFLMFLLSSCNYMVTRSCDIMDNSVSLYVTILPSFVAIGLGEEKYFVFNLSRELMGPRGQGLIWHYGWFFLIISHHSAKFSHHKSCARTNNLFSVCNVTMWLKGHLTLLLSFLHHESPSS